MQLASLTGRYGQYFATSKKVQTLEPMNSVEVGQFTRLRLAACYLLHLIGSSVSTSFTKLPQRYTAFEKQFDMKLHISCQEYNSQIQGCSLRGEWCGRLGQRSRRSSKLDSKSNILNKKIDFLRSTNLKLQNQKIKQWRKRQSVTTILLLIYHNGMSYVKIQIIQ